MTIVGGFVSINWYPFFTYLVAMSINRYMTICHDAALSRRVFGRGIAWALGCYLCGFAIGLPSFFPGCSVILAPDYYTWLYDRTICSQWFSKIDLILLCTVRIFSFRHIIQTVTFVLALNTRVYVYIRGTQKQLTVITSVKKREHRLFVMFFGSTLYFAVFTIQFNVLPHISEE